MLHNSTLYTPFMLRHRLHQIYIFIIILLCLYTIYLGISITQSRGIPAPRSCRHKTTLKQKQIYRMQFQYRRHKTIGLYRDVWIAAIASSRKSPATQTAAICVRFQGRRVRRMYVTMHVTFLTHKSALIYRRGLRQRVASLTLDCNGVFAIRAYGGTWGEFDCQDAPTWTISLSESLMSRSKMTLMHSLRQTLTNSSVLENMSRVVRHRPQ